MKKIVHRLLENYQPYSQFADVKISPKTPNTIKDHLAYAFCLHYILTNYPLKNKSKLLEVGCYYGLFVDFLTKLGYDIKGIDIEKQYIDYANKFIPNIITEDITNARKTFNASSFDLIIAINLIHKELNLKFKNKFEIDNWIIKIMKECYYILNSKGTIFFNSEIEIPIEEIKKIGFKIKYNLPTNINMKITYWVLEK